MAIAFAVLFLQIAPAMHGLPKAAVTAATAAASAKALPAAPVAKNLNTDAAGPGNTGQPTLLADRTASTAQNSQSLETIRVPQLPYAKPVKIVGVERVPSRKTWLILSIANHSAAAFDAYSTRTAVSRGAVEANPLVRPFAGSDGLYAAIQVMPLALDFVARHMQRSQNRVLRHTWWVPQTASTGLFLFAGAHNLTVARR